MPTLHASAGVEGAQQVAVGTSVSRKAAPAAKTTAVVPLPANYLAPAVQAKTASGKAPAVVLLPDTGNGASARAEARKLSKLGIATVTIVGPAAAPTQASAFEKAVAQARLALATLAKRPEIDPHRIGVIGEGVGAHIAAVAIGRKPGSVAAAVLADIGGIVVPSPSYAPDKWLARAVGTQMLFQRDKAKRAMTRSELTRLMSAAPPGTLMEEYKRLGRAAQKARDSWMKSELIVQ